MIHVGDHVVVRGVSQAIVTAVHPDSQVEIEDLHASAAGRRRKRYASEALDIRSTGRATGIPPDQGCPQRRLHSQHGETVWTGRTDSSDQDDHTETSTGRTPPSLDAEELVFSRTAS